MEKGDRTKKRIIEATAALFLKNGYSNTAISDILAATGLPKGSFYYSFKSKQELAVAVAEYYQQQYEEWFLNAYYGTDSYRGFVLKIAGDIHEQIRDNRYAGCPYTCFGTEASAIEPVVAKTLQEGIRRFLEIFQLVFVKNGMSEEQAKLKAGMALSMYEGYLVCYRIAREEKIIDHMVDALLLLEVDE